MNIDFSIALSGLSIVYMTVLMFGLRKNYNMNRENHIYFRLILLVAIFLFLDILYYYFYGRPGQEFRFILKSVKSCYFVVNTAIVCTWARFVDTTVLRHGNLPRYQRFYRSVFLINTAIVAVNYFTGCMFRISESGDMEVGVVAMWAFTLLNYGCAAAVISVVLMNRNKIKRSILVPLLMFPLLPLCAEIIQLFSRNISFACSYAVSAMMMYQVTQNNLIFTDALTGLGNRRLLDEYLNRWFCDAKAGELRGVMIDVDGLKEINDRYGHVAGDSALTAMAEVIRRSELRGVTATRYGGDEFILVWTSDSRISTDNILRRLEWNKKQINSQKHIWGALNFSVGDFCTARREGFSAEDFLKELDGKMYTIKRRKKGLQGHEDG